MLRSDGRFMLFLLFLLLTITTVLLIGDFKVRLANTLCDDNPVVFAQFFKNPLRFKGETLATYGPTYILSSMQNWLPAILFRWLNIPPEIFAWLFVYLQNVLLGLALFRYTRLVTGRYDIAWVTVFFSFVVYPWRWNLANYESIMSFPYSGHLVLPFIIFAAAEVIEGHLFKGAFFLLLSGLIHPALAIQMALIVAAFYFLQYRFREFKSLLKCILLLSVVMAFCVAPQLILRFVNHDQLSVSELMSGMRQNFHINSLSLKLFLNYRIPTFVGFMAVTVQAMRHHKKFIPNFLTFCCASLITTILFAFLHLAGFIWSVPRLLQLVPLRSTLIFIMLTLPLPVTYLVDKILSDRFLNRCIAASILFLFSLFGWGFFWAPLLALLLTDISEGHLAIFKFDLKRNIQSRFYKASKVIFLGWLVIVMAWGAYAVLGGSDISSQPFMSILIPGALINAKGYLCALTFAVVVGLSGWYPFGSLNKLWQRLTQSVRFSYGLISRLNNFMTVFHSHYVPVYLLTAILITMAVSKAYKIGRETIQPAARANYAAQLWARYNTADDAKFLVLIAVPWRTVSIRNTIFLDSNRFYIYSVSRQGKKIFDEINRFIREINPAQKKINEVDALRMAEHFGRDYIVCSRDNPLNLSEVYRNDYVVIYKISKS